MSLLLSNSKLSPGIPTAGTTKQPGVVRARGEWQIGHGGSLATGPSGTSFLSYSSILPENPRSTILEAAKPELNAKYPPSPYEKHSKLQKQAFLDDKEADIRMTFARTGFNPYVSESVSGLFQHKDPGNYVGAATIRVHFAQKLFETKSLAGFVKDREYGDGKKIQPVLKVDPRLHRSRAA